MEAARLNDEGTTFISQRSASPPAESATLPAAQASLPAQSTGVNVRIDEIVLCSGAGEVLYDWECRSLERRLGLIAQVEQQATQLSTLLPSGRFDRLEVTTPAGRVVCQVQPHIRLFVRSSVSPDLGS